MSNIGGADVSQAGAIERYRIGLALGYWGEAIRDRYACLASLECGGKCRLPTGHEPPCLCDGDTDGPGSCPA